MLPITKTFDLKKSVLDIKYCNGYYLCYDSSFNLHYIDGEKFSYEREKSLYPQSDTPNHEFSKNCAIANSGFLCFSPEGTKKSIVYKYNDEEGKRKNLKWHKGDTEVIRFSDDYEILATGGNDGKVYLFDGKNYRRITSLPNRPEYICSISFSKKSRFILASAFDNKTTVFDLKRSKEYCEFETSSPIEASKFFNGSKELLAVTREGECIIYNMYKKRISFQKKLLEFWPSVIEFTLDERFALIGTRDKELYIFDLQKKKILNVITLPFYGITSIEISERFILIGFATGRVIFVDYKKVEKELGNAVKTNASDKITNLVAFNPFLILSTFLEQFDENWDKSFDRFLNFVGLGKRAEAIRVIKPFLYDLEKKKETDFFLAYGDIAQEFYEFIENNAYGKAHQLADNNEYLKRYPAFKNIDKLWQKSYLKAKELMMKGTANARNSVEKMLQEYMEVPSKKELIDSLFKNWEVMLKADLCVRDKDFEQYFALCKAYPFLQEMPMYAKVQALGEKLQVNMENYTQNGDFEKAIETAGFLKTFSKSFENLESNEDEISAARIFEALLSEENYNEAYVLVEQYPKLMERNSYINIEKRFDEVIEIASQLSISGKAKEAYEKLTPIIGITYFQEKIIDILKTAYLVQIMYALTKKRDKNYDLAFLNYVERFGKDDEIYNIENRFHVRYLSSIEDPKTSSEEFFHKKFLDSIF